MLSQLKNNHYFLRNMSWMAVAEILIRVTRIVATIVLARYLSQQDYGVAAIALAVAEFIRVLTNNGIGIKIINSSAKDLDRNCNIVYRLNWLISSLIFVVQVLMAPVAAFYYGINDLSLLLIALAFPYIVYPFAMVHVYLAQRTNDLKLTGLMLGGIVGLDNLVSAVLVLLGFEVWSVVLPKLIVAPIWVAIYRQKVDWMPSKTVRWRAAFSFFSFGKTIFLTEFLKVLRHNVDVIIIAKVLGLELAGLYAFAKNAGLGISLSLINALNTALLPKLCAVSNKEVASEFRKGIKLATITVLPLIAVQAALASMYVPLLFGDKWSHATSLVTLLCLSAIPRTLVDAFSPLMRVLEQQNLELRIATQFSFLYIVGCLLSAHFGLMFVASFIGLAYALFAIIIYVFVLKKVSRFTRYEEVTYVVP
ncbi:MAG: oligosaccharide flippase family protein [Pseudomonadales bacterium]